MSTCSDLCAATASLQLSDAGIPPLSPEIGRTSWTSNVDNLGEPAQVPATPLLRLRDGNLIPQIGLGVLRVENGRTADVVEGALRAGYRHIDAAAGYGNEREVGEGLKRLGFDKGELRKSLWITTKVKDTNQGYDSTLRAFDEQISDLGLEYVDMYMIHWPTPFDWRSADTWRAFRKLRSEGRIRTLGVCNFLPEHLERLADEVGELPAIDQIELHPTFQHRDVVEYCENKGIVVEAYEPLARTADLHAGDGLIDRLAQAHQVSNAQIILRWHLQKGYVLIPKSVHLNRQVENASILDFSLSDEEMAEIDSLNTATRVGHDPLTFSYA